MPLRDTWSNRWPPQYLASRSNLNGNRLVAAASLGFPRFHSLCDVPPLNMQEVSIRGYDNWVQKQMQCNMWGRSHNDRIKSGQTVLESDSYEINKQKSYWTDLIHQISERQSPQVDNRIDAFLYHEVQVQGLKPRKSRVTKFSQSATRVATTGSSTTVDNCFQFYHHQHGLLSITHSFLSIHAEHRLPIMNLDNLRDTIQNISLYDVKAAVRKAQNVVMNYTEMEAKVREATNNEPWGASSTLMQEIASGTYNYQLLNEIMPMIYKRFTEKSAEEWRQIYKALQLLEYLVKHGSEQVIDDGRSHLSTIKMLRQFHFIDMNGKDQGINVRNRAKELAELLSDVDRIRQERKKARASKNKYGGVEGGGGAYGGMGGSSSGMGGDNGFGRRYGGFGSESSEFGGYSGGVYGDGGGFGGRTGGFHDEGSSRPSSRTQKFEEYDEYDDGATATRRSGASSSTRRKEPAAAPAKPPKKKEPEVDLFSFGDEPTPTVSSSKQKQTTSVLDDDFGTLQSGGADDDDFDDFQSASGAAPSAPATFQAPPTAAPKTFSPLPPLTASASSTKLMQPTPMSAGQAMGINDLVGIASISPAPARGMASPPAMTPASTGGGLAGMGGMGSMSSVSGMGGMGGMGGMAAMKPVSTAPTGYQPTQPNYFTSMSTTTISSGTPLSPASTGASATAAKKSTNDAFGNIWSMASKDIKKPSTPVNNSNSPSLQSLAKEKASAGIWGAPAASGTSRASSAYGGSTAGKTGGGLDDLLG